MDANLPEQIRDLCQKESAILAAYLFGSAAAGKDKASSDLDLALLLRQDLADSFPVPAFISALDRICRCPVDVVVLNRAGEVLKHQVRKSGRLIFERDPAKRKAFELAGRKSYEDFLYLHKRYVKSVLYGERRG